MIRLDRLDNLEKLNRLDNLDVTLNSYETKQESESTQEESESGLACPLCGFNPNTPAKLREHMAYKHFTENIKARYCQYSMYFP